MARLILFRGLFSNAVQSKRTVGVKPRCEFIIERAFLFRQALRDKEKKEIEEKSTRNKSASYNKEHVTEEEGALRELRK